MTQMYFINKVMWAHPKYFDLITDSFNAMYFQNSLKEKVARTHQ